MAETVAVQLSVAVHVGVPVTVGSVEVMQLPSVSSVTSSTHSNAKPGAKSSVKYTTCDKVAVLPQASVAV